MVQILPFQLGEGLYGLELAHIQQLVDAPLIFYLPGAPEEILGAINLHGRILPVLDLPQFFGFSKGPRGKRMIVLSEQATALVLAVDRIHAVMNAESPLIKPCQNVFAKECVANVLDWDGKRCRLVDVKLLRERVGQLCGPTGG